MYFDWAMFKSYVSHYWRVVGSIYFGQVFTGDDSAQHPRAAPSGLPTQQMEKRMRGESDNSAQQMEKRMRAESDNSAQKKDQSL